VKFNIDASFSSLDNKVGIDTCIKLDESDAFVLPKTEWYGLHQDMRCTLAKPLVSVWLLNMFMS
jgi:hypothetical protein